MCTYTTLSSLLQNFFLNCWSIVPKTVIPKSFYVKIPEQQLQQHKQQINRNIPWVSMKQSSEPSEVAFSVFVLGSSKKKWTLIELLSRKLIGNGMPNHRYISHLSMTSILSIYIGVGVYEFELKGNTFALVNVEFLPIINLFMTSQYSICKSIELYSLWWRVKKRQDEWKRSLRCGGGGSRTVVVVVELL